MVPFIPASITDTGLVEWSHSFHLSFLVQLQLCGVECSRYDEYLRRQSIEKCI
jgi:hypothetical protein